MCQKIEIINRVRGGELALCKHCNMKIARNVKDYTIFNKHCSNMIRRYKIKNLNQVPEHAVLPDVSIS